VKLHSIVTLIAATALLGTSQNDHSTVRVKGPGTDAAFHGVNWAMHPFESAPY